MTWEIFAIILTVVGLIAALLVFVFQTKNNCGKCQSDCRSKLYKKLEEKADEKDVEKLNDYFLKIMVEVAQVSTKIDGIKEHLGHKGGE